MNQAQHALIDPLIEPDPSDETGLNSHFRSTFGPQQPITPPGSAGLPKDQSTVHIEPQGTGASVETNPYRRSRASTGSANPFGDQHSQTKSGRISHDYPSPPGSASPRREHFKDYRSEALGALNEGRSRRSSNPAPPSYSAGGLRRGGSLRERYPGDVSHRPLDVIRNDEKVAHRSPHLRKKNFQGADMIDRLDEAALASYHHEGPYDAASFARNRNPKYAPVEAVRGTNTEALKATPQENIVDAVTRHRPLEGVADIPPGKSDRFGRVLFYEEGADLQREPGGDYRRWYGLDYRPDDLKGKGEPAFSLDKAARDNRRISESGTEMFSRPSTRRQHSRSVGHADAPRYMPSEKIGAESTGVARSNTTGRNMGSSLKKRFGSIRRRKEVEA